MDEGISIEEANQRTHYRWTVLPQVPTDLLIEELLKRDEIWSRKLGEGERFELYGPYLVMAFRK